MRNASIAVAAVVILGVAGTVLWLRRPPLAAPAKSTERPGPGTRWPAAPPAEAPVPPSERPPVPATPAGPVPAPPPDAAPGADPLADWKRRLGSMNRVADVLALSMAEGDVKTRSQALLALYERVRDLLGDPTAQAGFLVDLPAMSTDQIVKLWDVLWMSERVRVDGLAAYGGDFGGNLTRVTLSMIPATPDATRRGLLVNLLTPHAAKMADGDLEAFRAMVESDPDEEIRRKAEKIRRP